VHLRCTLWSASRGCTRRCTRPRCRVIHVSVNVAVTAGTAQTIHTPASGKKFRVRAYHLALSVAGGIMFEEGAADSAVLRLPTRGVAVPVSGRLGPGKLSAAADNALKIDATASGTVTGWVQVSEE
jgi:hypothetical protein